VGIVALAELGLWAVGFGPSNRLFLLDESGSYVANPAVTHRFFPPHLRRTPARAAPFAARKPAATVRVFALGASTLVGFPNPPGSDVVSFLQLMLTDIFPSRRFEIVNCGITAVNSHCFLDFGREVLDLDPDLLLVYGGHNEFLGPYGPTTPFVRFGNRLPLIRLHMWVQGSRLYSGAKGITLGLSSRLRGEPERFGLHLVTEEIDLTEASYTRTVDNYRTNLQHLLAAADEAEVPVLLGTLVSNLSGFYPLRSQCAEADGVNARILAEDVDSLVRRGRFADARQRARDGLRRSPACAAAHFELAQLYLRVGQGDEARAAFVQARDLDRVPFRAPTVFNHILQQVAAGSERAVLAEVEKGFSSASPDGIVGDELMTDYLHPNVEGHYLMARWLAASLIDSPAASDWGPARPTAMGDFDHYRARLGQSELAALMARNNLLLFLRNMPYEAPPHLLRQRVAALIEAQAAACAQLSVADRETFRQRGGLAFLSEVISFAPAAGQRRLRAVVGSL
jgi:lysophospholipase L1-like esterase